MRRCKHDFTRLRFKDGSERQGLTLEAESKHMEHWPPELPAMLLSARCDDCGEQLSLGHADENTWAWSRRRLFNAASVDHADADAWPWDVSRPVAGQFEEWVRRTSLHVALTEVDDLDTADDPIMPDPDPKLAELAAEYLASDEGKAAYCEVHQHFKPCMHEPHDKYAGKPESAVRGWEPK